MIITSKYLKWASYSVYEGPAFYGCGNNPGQYHIPENPTQDDIILATLTATEGGSWNLVNMYDKCKCTVGLIQWCEAGMFGVSDMLGKLVSMFGPELLWHLEEPMKRLGLTFKQTRRGKWRFHFGTDEVDTKADQTRMFFLNASGKKGEWDLESKTFAQAWVLGFANLFGERKAIEAQKAFTVPRLKYFFLLEQGRKMIKEMPNTPIARAFQAALLSYAGNNPRWAEDNLKVAMAGSRHKAWTQGWLEDCLYQWTYGPNCSIYPHRYNRIRPVLEKHYGLDLPDHAKDLDSDMLDSGDVQRILVSLGYDLGSSGPNGDGVDGKWGPKSKTALIDYQKKKGLKQTGWPNLETNDSLLRQNTCEDLAGAP